MKFFNNSGNKEHVVAVLLRHDEGEGYLFEVSEAGKSVAIADQRAFKFTNGWENLTYDIDELLFYLENDHKIKLKQVVFFIYSHLIDLNTREVASSYRDILTKIVDDNDIEALGYLEMDQVVAKYIEQKEQQPLSAVVVEIDTPAVSLFMYQAGALVFSESVARTENIIADLNEIFQHTSKDTILPSRLIMYDAGGLKDEASKIIAHKWPKDTFIHMPKVEILNEDDLHGGLIAAYKEQILDATPQENQPAASTYTEEETVESQSSPADLGFVIGTDVKKAELPEPIAASATIQENAEPYTEMHNKEGASIISKIKNMIKIPRLSLPAKAHKTFAGVILIIMLLFGALVGSLYYAHSATIIIFYDKAEIKESIDFDKAAFVEKKSEKIQTESSVKTTGTKKVGEKAKGEVTIFNATLADKMFKKGTKIIASNKLEFVLSNDVTVKAATITITTGGDILTTTSKEKIDVVAVELGTSYNISKDTKFTFEGSSETTYFAKSNVDFAGGTEKEVQTVSKEDVETLKSDVEKQINKKKADSLKKSDDTHKIINQLTEVDIVKEDYSKDVSEEAKTLNASVTAEVTYYLYDDDKVKAALVLKMKDKVPDNYDLNAENINFNVKSAEKNDAGINVTLAVTAQPFYKIDTKKILPRIKGISTNNVEKIIKEVTDAKGFSINVVSPIPFFKFITPFFDKNFNISAQPIE